MIVVPVSPPEIGEDDLIPLSALQHYLYCPRQCALIHVEQQWAENRFTAEGRLLHDRTDRGGGETRRGVRIARAVPIRSLRLGVTGVADVVELHDRGRRPVPVEYKRGRPKAHRADEVQLCAQAICLEEIFGVPVVEGYLFYGRTKRRIAVAFDPALRNLTARVADEARRLFARGRTPPPTYEPRKCGSCSLSGLCHPERLADGPDIGRWLAAQIEA